MNVDVSAELGGYFADTGGSKIVPPTTPQIYNYGQIGGGVNKGFCIDEPGDPAGSGC